MRKVFFFLFVLLLCLAKADAQTVTLSVLTNGAWEMVSPDLSDYRKTVYQFSNCKIQESLYIVKLDRQVVLSHDYYLSDEPVTAFDKSQVRKHQSGRYIIHHDTGGKAFWYQVTSISADRLRLKTPDGLEIELKKK